MILWLAVAFAQEASGFVELRGSYAAGVDGTAWTMTERARPSVTSPVGERVRLTATAELGISQGRWLPEELRRTVRESDLGAAADALCGWSDDDVLPRRYQRVGDYAELDRLHADIYLPAVDLRIGRQALQWGSGMFFNPTDPFPEVLLAEPWRPRRGVNAVRATFPVGERHQIQAVAAIDDALRYARVASRATLNVGGADISGVWAWRGDRRDGIVGLDVRGTLGVGYWFEGAVHLGGPTDPRVWEELSVGLDYSFPVLERLLVSAQYYRNGRGGADASAGGLAGRLGAGGLPDCPAADLSQIFGASADPDPFAPFVGGRDYLLVMANLGFLPEVSATVAGLANLGDGSALLIPTITTRPTGWLEISAVAQVPVAFAPGGGEFRPSAASLVVRPPGVPGSIDFSGLVPDATFILWTRANF